MRILVQTSASQNGLSSTSHNLAEALTDLIGKEVCHSVYDGKSDGWRSHAEHGSWQIQEASFSAQNEIESLLPEADVVLSPIAPDFDGMKGANELTRVMQQCLGTSAAMRVLLEKYNGRSAMHREVRAHIAGKFGSETLLPVVVRNSSKIEEAMTLGLSIFDYAPSSTGAQDYMALARYLQSEAEMNKQSQRRFPQ